jgi:hypothetical protein
MNKYQLLSDHLAASSGDEWLASFSELEAVLGFPLPKAARTGRSWWTNDLGKSHSRAWAAKGWHVGDVDHAAQEVLFRRGALPAAARAETAHSSRGVQPPAMREAAETASARNRTTRTLGAAAMVTAGVAVVAGLGAMLARGVTRRSR